MTVFGSKIGPVLRRARTFYVVHAKGPVYLAKPDAAEPGFMAATFYRDNAVQYERYPPLADLADFCQLVGGAVGVLRITERISEEPA